MLEVYRVKGLGFPMLKISDDVPLFTKSFRASSMIASKPRLCSAYGRLGSLLKSVGRGDPVGGVVPGGTIFGSLRDYREDQES